LGKIKKNFDFWKFFKIIWKFSGFLEKFGKFLKKWKY